MTMVTGNSARHRELFLLFFCPIGHYHVLFYYNNWGHFASQMSKSQFCACPFDVGSAAAAARPTDRQNPSRNGQTESIDTINIFTLLL